MLHQKFEHKLLVFLLARLSGRLLNVVLGIGYLRQQVMPSLLPYNCYRYTTIPSFQLDRLQMKKRIHFEGHMEVIVPYHPYKMPYQYH